MMKGISFLLKVNILYYLTKENTPYACFKYINPVLIL